MPRLKSPQEIAGIRSYRCACPSHTRDQRLPVVRQDQNAMDIGSDSYVWIQTTDFSQNLRIEP